MGKNSLIKSTDKKKAKTKKKEDEAKTKRTSKKATATASTKSTKSTKKSPKTKKTTAGKTTKKAPAKKSKPKLTLKDLIFKKFDPLPGNPAPLPAPKTIAAPPEAPPVITSDDPNEVERLRGLLNLQFSMEEIKAVAKEPEPKAKPAPPAQERAAAQPEPAKPPVALKDLIFKKFEPLPGKPEPLPAVEVTTDIPAAPPVITSDDPKEVERLRALLNLQFSMEEIKAVAKEPVPIPEPPSHAISTSEPGKAEAEAPPAEQTAPEEPKTAEPAPRPAVAAQSEKTVRTPPSADDKATIDTGSGADFNNEPDPVQRAMKYGVVGFIVLVLLLIGASYKNSGKFFIETKQDAIDISRGRFSPMGKKHFILLHGVQLPESDKSVYTRKDVYPIVYSYYLAKADALLNVKTFPDYESIKSYLHDAKAFAITKEMKTEISDRLNTIDRMTLMFKADISIRQNTPESLEQASDYLKAAGKLTTDETQTEMILKRMAEIKDRQAALELDAAASAAEQQPETELPEEQTETNQAH